jgi:hypothetical protein
LESIYYNSELKQEKAEHITPEATIYPETQFYYFKNKQQFFLAAKGGHNAESHNHNDIGTFSLWFEETPIFIDAGVGTYTRQTFGSERYSIWTMRSIYHNLPLVNGAEQREGRNYQAQNQQYDVKKRSVSFELAKACPAAAQLKSWVRKYQLQADGLVISDKFELEKAEIPNEINFMLWGKIDTGAKGKILIDVQGKKMELLYDEKLFSPLLETIELPDSRLSNVWGSEIYRLTLKAKNTAIKGEYKFTVKKR